MSQRAAIRLLSIVLAILASSCIANAAQVALIGDASVSSARPATNFGSLANLYVGNGNTAYLQFDLGSLPVGTTSTQIARATLTVFVNRVNAAGSVSLAPVTSAWSESAVTSSSAPSVGATSGIFLASAAGQYVTLDVTALVQGWVTTPATNFGFALTSDTANLLLDSKENDETGHAATLDVTITSEGATGPQGIQGPIGPQGPTGATGANGAPGPIGPQGIPGSAGATGTVGPIGPQGPTGTIGVVTNWSSTTIYQIGQVVFYPSSGSSYAAIQANFNVPPTADPTVWNLIAEEGATGATGPAGPIGLTGPQGVAGPVGPAGPTGATGVTGPQGPTGTIGVVTNWSSSTIYQIGQVVFYPVNGSSYAAIQANFNVPPTVDPTVWNLIAEQGATGPAGAAGPAGPTGATGAQGPIGVTGATGATGPAGPAGPTGTFSEAGNWSSGSTYQAGQVAYCTVCSSNGSSYIALSTNTDIDPPTNPAVWSLVAHAGAAGATGAAGTPGSTGATGATGPAGPTGPAGTGTVTSVTVASVLNTAAAGAGTLTITAGTTTTAPTININFPNAAGSGGNLAFGGTAANGEILSTTKSTFYLAADQGTFTLPAATTAGQQLIFTDNNPTNATSQFTVQTNGGTTMNNSPDETANTTSLTAVSYVTMVSDGTGHWWIITVL